MKRILCFGDSNTYGFIPQNGGRYDKNSRWAGILSSLCGNDFEVVECGGNNRTAFSDSVNGESFTGYKILSEVLNENFDFVILAIGINDLQKFYNHTKKYFEQGIEMLVKLTKQKLPSSKIILLTPNIIGNEILNSGFAFLFDENSIQKSRELSEIYKKVAINNSCENLDLNEIVATSKIDGLHFDKNGHEKIAQTLYGVMFAS